MQNLTEDGNKSTIPAILNNTAFDVAIKKYKVKKLDDHEVAALLSKDNLPYT